MAPIAGGAMALVVAALVVMAVVILCSIWRYEYFTHSCMNGVVSLCLYCCIKEKNKQECIENGSSWCESSLFDGSVHNR